MAKRKLTAAQIAADPNWHIDEIAVLMKDPSWETPIGQLYIGCDPEWYWFVLPQADISDCRHEETVCKECIDSWRQDYWVRVLMHNMVIDGHQYLYDYDYPHDVAGDMGEWNEERDEND